MLITGPGRKDLMTGMARMFSTVATLISMLVRSHAIKFDQPGKEVSRLPRSRLPDNLCIMYLSVVSVWITPY